MPRRPVSHRHMSLVALVIPPPRMSRRSACLPAPFVPSPHKFHRPIHPIASSVTSPHARHRHACPAAPCPIATCIPLPCLSRRHACHVAARVSPLHSSHRSACAMATHIPPYLLRRHAHPAATRIQLHPPPSPPPPLALRVPQHPAGGRSRRTRHPCTRGLQRRPSRSRCLDDRPPTTAAARAGASAPAAAVGCTRRRPAARAPAVRHPLRRAGPGPAACPLATAAGVAGVGARVLQRPDGRRAPGVPPAPALGPGRCPASAAARR
jgi:hypothetical protein